jgi:hypothetical protein
MHLFFYVLIVIVSSGYNEGLKSYITYLTQTFPGSFTLMGIYTGFQGLEVYRLKKVLKGEALRGYTLLLHINNIIIFNHDFQSSTSLVQKKSVQLSLQSC